MQIRKSPEAAFLEGLSCLKQADLGCAQLALNNIPSQSSYAKLLAGNIAAAEGDFDRAFRLLLPLQSSNSLTPKASASLHASLALAYENQADTLRALEQRILAEADLTDAQEIETNQQRIWQLLTGLSRDELVEMRGESFDTTLQGWLDLALTVQASASVQKINDWRKAYPDHAVSSVLLEKLRAQASVQQSAAGGLNGQIALLLPFEVEAFYPASDAIERGFMAAQSQYKGEAAVKIYATAGSKDDIAAIYQQAVNDGAQYVVGPLTRDEIATLAATELKVPTLALNQPDTSNTSNISTNLYVLSLSVDAEAAQLVKIAREYGMQSAAIVTTDNPLSAHMAKAFSDAWTAEGGQLKLQVAVTATTELADLKAQVAGQPADMIVLAASAEEARSIRPYLDIATPTFGFSHIYAGIAHEPLDAMLSAIRFVDLPWMLNPDNSSWAAYRMASADLPPGEMQRWFALGVDAYQLLQTLAQHKSATINGLTGKIRVSSAGEITRELALGRFSSGGIVVEKLP